VPKSLPHQVAANIRWSQEDPTEQGGTMRAGLEARSTTPTMNYPKRSACGVQRRLARSTTSAWPLLPLKLVGLARRAVTLPDARTRQRPPGRGGRH
jgi:hypothetical protein